MKTPKLIQIKTKRYVLFFNTLFDFYKSDIEVIIDGKVYKNENIKNLKAEWCVKNRILRTKDFSVKKDGEEIYGFHDNIYELWASYSELTFIESLFEKNILRYRIQNEKNYSLIVEIFKALKNYNKKKRKAKIENIRELAKLEFKNGNYSKSYKYYSKLKRYCVLNEIEKRKLEYCKKNI